MRKRYSLLVAFITCQLVVAQKSITLEDIWKNYSYYPQYLYGLNSMNDGLNYTIQGDKGVEKYDYKTGNKIGDYTFGDLKIEDYTFSSDESKILVSTENEGIYRHSSKGYYHVYDIKSQKTTSLPKHNKIMSATFNPAATQVAYVADNNIFIYDLASNQETQVTTDGKINSIINGQGDWVYEEELVLVRAFEWSNDGKKIAFVRFDETDVPKFEMAMFKGGLYPKDYEFKYPKVGEKNSVVTAHIYDVTSKKLDKIEGLPEYEYIPRLKWTPANELLVFTMNRLQNNLKINKVTSTSGNNGSRSGYGISLLMEESAPCYLEINDHMEFLSDGSFIWVSEKSGYNHIYLHNSNGSVKTQITNGSWDVTDVYGVDEKAKVIYFESAEVSPMERHAYSISLDGKNKIQLTKNKGVNSVEFTNGFQYYIVTNSTIATAPSVTLYDKKGKEVRKLIDNSALDSKLKSTGINTPEFFTFKNSGGTVLNGYMIKPANFDPKKKYPVFMYVYGGPGSQEAKDEWQGPNYLWFQMLAQQGYIIACVDNRGTGARGREFRTCTYKQMGKLEVDDQIDAAKYLGSLEYVDKSRIGIFGWSYGGYMTSLCITRGADVFKAAIAVAPVTNWKFYDSIYTERYMGTKESNPDGYDANAPTSYADKLKGNFLLVHGTADDNVHWQNSAELINAMVKANKQFDLFIYPDKNHGIYGGNTRIHLYTKMTNFVKEKL
jgi:dipeptidyl-peptidase 4